MATNYKVKIPEAFIEEEQYLNLSNINGIKALEKAMNSYEIINDQEINSIQQLLLNSIANEHLNKNTSEILKNPNKCSNIHISTVVLLNLFTHCTRHYNCCPTLSELKNAIDAIINNFQIADNSFSVEQIGVINDLALIEDFINTLEQKQIFTNNTKLTELRDKVKLANQINQMISNHLINDDMLDQVNGGNIVKQFTKQDLLKNLVEYYVNITKLINLPNKEISHEETNISQDNQQTEELEKRLFSNFYKIDLNQLFTKENQKILQKLYGKQWREEIASMIKEIENKIIADYIHDKESTQNTIKTFGEIHHYSSTLDHSILNDEHHNMKYNINKDRNMLMLISQEHIMCQIIENLENNITSGINKSNILNLKGTINIVKKPIRLHLIKEK